MRVGPWLSLALITVVGVAHADTESDVWKVTVNLWIPYVGNPLEGVTYKTFGQAEAAMRAAHEDAPFLKRYSQAYNAAYYNIPAEDVDFWSPWLYDQTYATEAEMIAPWSGGGPCGENTFVPTTGWTPFEIYAASERERRTYHQTNVFPNYIPGVGYSCSSTHSGEADIVFDRTRTRVCPAGPPFHGSGVGGDGLCHNGLTAYVLTHTLLQGTVVEDAGPRQCVGNPCDPSTGAKIESAVDYQGYGLDLTRHYNSGSHVPHGGGFGSYWTHPYETRLIGTSLWVRPDGQYELLTQPYWTFITERSGAQLIQSGSEWELNVLGGGKYRYDSAGKLLWLENALGQRTTVSYGTDGISQVTGPFGHTLAFTYANGKIQSVTDPSGQTISYAYNSSGMLDEVAYQDLTSRTYHYEDSNFPYLLTGVTDENGDRYSTFAYDSAGRVTSTQHAGGYELRTLTYNSDASTTVTDALSNVTTFQFASVLSNGSAGRRRPTATTTDGQTYARTYNTGSGMDHRLASTTDENGAVTKYDYLWTTGRRTSKTEAYGTSAARTTSYQYLNDTRDLLTQVSSPSVKASSLRTVVIGYDTSQRPTSITVNGFKPASAGGAAVSRSVSFQYNSYDQVTEINGPRTDVSDITTLTYYECTTGSECGQLESVTNALGHETTFDLYDDHGRLLQATDPNGVVTEYEYDLRGRVLTVTETPPSGPARETAFDYDYAGQIVSVETPIGTTLTYDYDAAHNLLSITDNLGNTVEYGYDLNGNRTSEDTRDPATNLRRAIDLTYDVRNRIETINAAGSVTEVVFDAVGNLTDESDPNSNDTDHGYDAFNRLVQTIDALSGVTEYGYDKTDNVVSVEAPNGATTAYVYDDLGNLLSMTSPDTGTTTYTYDAAGNRLSETDARSITVNYSYDVLNRLTSTDYPGSTLDVTFVYDEGTAQKGRLTTVTDGSGSTSYAYDAVGNLTQESKTIDGNTHVTAYSYDADDLLAGITYPSGRTVSYTRNVLGQVTAVDSSYGGSNTTVASSVAYEPFGPLEALTFGNSLALDRTFDQQYRLTDQTTGSVQDLAFTLDAAGNIDAIADGVTSGLSQGFAQDVLHRVTTDGGSYGTKNYSYDAAGNRLTRTVGASTQTLTYTASSNRIATHDGQTISLDAAGNTLADPAENVSFTYGAHNRMLEVYVGAALKATYVYDGRGQRIKKVEATGAQRTVIYHYGQGGELLGETIYNSAGAKIGERDYLWLDALPLAQSERTFSGGTVTSSSFVYLHADQLNTPRLATNNSGTVVWRWDSDAFGVGAANQDPDSDTNLVNVRLRLPGQYLDEETGLNYNYFRDYDAVTGRYVQSDPTGLSGGLNTYLYVGANPLKEIDPAGLGPYDLFDTKQEAAWDLFEHDAAIRAHNRSWKLMLLSGGQFTPGAFGTGDPWYYNDGTNCGWTWAPMPVRGGYPPILWIRNPAAVTALARGLSSEAGVAELTAGGGRAIAGAGSSKPLHDIVRLVKEHGGHPGQWAKVTSTIEGGIQTHAYRNVITGELVELKSMIR